jgi:hypothetical protein
MSLTGVNRALLHLKDYGPYGICFGLMLFGASLFALGSSSERPAAVLVEWSGAVSCVLGVVAFVLWHFFKWPSWFALRTRRQRR